MYSNVPKPNTSDDFDGFDGPCGLVNANGCGGTSGDYGGFHVLIVNDGP